tara:strand:+ start:1271 stop:2158 length:888 start_codon:yes stop_codon:yes gene_type:complete
MNNEEKYLKAAKEIEEGQKDKRKKCILHYTVFDWVKKNIPEGSRILEIGSGKSSLIFSYLYKVDSVEHDPKYVGKHRNVNYIHAPIREYKKYYWYDLDVLKEKLGKKYDLIIVDGPTSKTGREGFAVNFELFEKYDCPILIDEIDKELERKMLQVFLDSGFEKISEGKKHVIVKRKKENEGKKGNKTKKLTNLKKELVEGLLENNNLVICSLGDVDPPEWLREKGDYHTCIIHSKDNNEKKFKLKDLADYFISEKGTLKHQYKKAFEELPKMKFYKKIVYLKENFDGNSKEVEKS